MAFPPAGVERRHPELARTDATDNDKDMIVYNTFDHRVYWFTEMQKFGSRWCAFQMSVYGTGSNGRRVGCPRVEQPVELGPPRRVADHPGGALRRGRDGQHPPRPRGVHPQHRLPLPLSGRWTGTPTARHTRAERDPGRRDPADQAGRQPGRRSRSTRRRGSSPARCRPTARSWATTPAPATRSRIKLEDTVTEGRGNLWAEAGLNWESLSRIPISDYQIDKLGAPR